MSPEKGPFWKENFIFEPAFLRGYDICLDVTQVNKSKFQFYRPKSSEKRLLGYVAAYLMVLHDTLNGSSFHKSSLSSLLISEIQDHLRCIKTLQIIG